MKYEIRKYAVYKNGEPIFALERQENCIAMIPMNIYTDLIDDSNAGVASEFKAS